MSDLDDKEMAEIFQRIDDCYLLNEEFGGIECCPTHHHQWYVLRDHRWYSVCYNAMATFEVHLRKQDQILWCVVCERARDWCTCGWRKARYVIREKQTQKEAEAEAEAAPDSYSSLGEEIGKVFE